jgi:uncharacterized RDD family membrane protein YckC
VGGQRAWVWTGRVAPGPFVLVGLVYFTWFHATSAGQSIGNKIPGIRVLDADSGRPVSPPG